MQMLNPFVCGTFHDDHEDFLASSGSSPRKCKRKDNPYSTRGLDKFSELLSDLNEKRQRIYSQMNPHDISFVRFVHSNTDDFVPIIVKVKNKDQKHKSQELKVVKARNLTPNNSESATEHTSIMEERKLPKLESDRKVAKKRLSWNILNNLDKEKPYFYLPVIVMLILMLLTVFGRSAAAIFTCILWYVVPTLKEYSSSNTITRRPMKKKRDYVRGLSEKKMVVRSSNIEEGVKNKKDYVRGFSEKKMVVSEGIIKKKDYVRGWSEKKMSTDGLLSPKSGDYSEASNNNIKIQGKHSHKKSW